MIIYNNIMSGSAALSAAKRRNSTSINNIQPPTTTTSTKQISMLDILRNHEQRLVDIESVVETLSKAKVGEEENMEENMEENRVIEENVSIRMDKLILEKQESDVSVNKRIEELTEQIKMLTSQINQDKVDDTNSDGDDSL
jgi:hypothetical protein